MKPFDVAKDAKGWLHDVEGPALHKYAQRAPAGLPLLEIGTYCGKSTCWIGPAARDKDTVLFTVDHHRGSPEMAAGQNCHDPDVVVDGRHDTLPELRRNLAAAGLEDVVVPVVGSSTTVGPWWSIMVGFIFIDGGHDKQTAQADYRNFSPYLTDGGFLIFHDAYGTEARHAVQNAKDDGLDEIDLVGCMAVFQKR